MLRWATYILAVLGLAVGVYTAATAQHEPPRAPLAGEPSVNPFDRGIAAAGVVEAASRNVPIAAPEGGLVTRVFVEVGQEVRAGDPLFELDPRPVEAELIRAQAARDAAAARLARLEAEPRPETIPPLEAVAAAAAAEVRDLESRLARWEAVADPRAVPEDELSRIRFSLQGARARLAQAEANLALARAGAWSKEVEVTRAELAQAEAQVRAVQILLDRRTIRSPIDATVLKRSVEPGQFAPAEPRISAMTLGDLSQLHIRARVDEEDLPLLRAGAKGIARIRGRVNITTPLTMLRIEPLAQPKTELSGDTTERVDTRVLDVVFRVDGDHRVLPLYPGQFVDVFIEGADPAVPEAGTPAGGKR